MPMMVKKREVYEFIFRHKPPLFRERKKKWIVILIEASLFFFYGGESV